ncbi:uncharacterized protein LOC113358938 [Papaver somniferum]|uniref:uncharacterized protein LOC113358938 n=1 Tax=Papaver somniferum TaxID=3469 RepID=UPI000E6FD024|nr:uncharacterized protein LOC113358938 [Papaver somniferum]
MASTKRYKDLNDITQENMDTLIILWIIAFWIALLLHYDNVTRRPTSKYPAVSYFWQFFTSLAWNCQGLGTRDAKRYLNDMLNKLNPDIIFLSETRLKSDKLKKIVNELGISNFWYVNPGGASGTAGGLALIWKTNVSLEILDCSINHLNAKISISNSPIWLFTGYYGNPYNTTSKLHSWQKLETTAVSNKLPWLHTSIDANEASAFNENILNLDLTDLGFTGCPFTWSNKRKGHALTEQRLDRGLANDDWIAIFPNTTITNLLAIGSDHHPILLNSNPHSKNGKIPFKFFGPWLDHEDCRKIIAECWKKYTHGSSAFSIARKLKNIKLNIGVWNKEVYGNIKTNIDECKQHLTWLHTYYFGEDRGQTLVDAREQLKKWQDIEEKFWKTNSRDQLIKIGDHNKSYFTTSFLGIRNPGFVKIEELKYFGDLKNIEGISLIYCSMLTFLGILSSSEFEEEGRTKKPKISTDKLDVFEQQSQQGVIGFDKRTTEGIFLGLINLSKHDKNGPSGEPKAFENPTAGTQLKLHTMVCTSPYTYDMRRICLLSMDAHMREHPTLVPTFSQEKIASVEELDYIVSVESDVFIPSYSGNIARAVEGHRIFLVHRKIFSPDRKALVHLFDRVE